MALNENNQEKTSIIPYDEKRSNKKLRPFVELKQIKINDFTIRHVHLCDTRKLYFVIKDVYARFGNQDPGASARMFQFRNKDKFQTDSFKKFEINTPRGKQKLLMATFDVINFICSRANSDIAFDYLKAVGKLHQKLFEGELSLVPSQEAINLFLQEQQFKTSLIEKRLDQVTSALNQINNSFKQFQIDSQIETSILPETGTIGKKQEETIRFLINDTAIDGIHSNTIYNQFKRKFKIYYIENLLKTDYKKAIIWFNKYQDQIKKRETKKPKRAKLDNWFESSFPQGNTKRGIDA